MQVVDFSSERAMRTLASAMKLFVVEYSVNENATMIRTLDNVIQDNIKNVKKPLSKDYVPVGVFDTREAADRFHFRLNLLLAEQERLPFESRDWRRIGECLEHSQPFIEPSVENKTGVS